ncbi:MAG: hypothetical protein AB1847_22725, partial [bacterium]
IGLQYTVLYNPIQAVSSQGHSNLRTSATTALSPHQTIYALLGFQHKTDRGFLALSLKPPSRVR